MRIASISTTICSKFCVPGKYETGSLQSVSYIIINGIFAVIGGYKYGGINNRPVITKNKLATKAIIIETTTILKFRLIIEKLISALVSFNGLNQILLEQNYELVLELEILKFEISLLNGIYIAC